MLPHTNCLLQLIGKEWAYLAPCDSWKERVGQNLYLSVVLLSLIDKVVTLHKKLEDVKKDQVFTQ